ncbi:MAG: YkgJ family cysteine cluster protein [Desulfamplus sp.]|nr:YkgJ family cysteine cluster protein [Desulfamplus sp.]
MTSYIKKTECKRCGKCCTKGGPVLHIEDKTLVEEGHIPINRIITIRSMEPAHSPHINTVEPAASEMLKISGQGKEWTCAFFQPSLNNCGVYKTRPIECKLLFCEDTAGISAVIGKELLQRSQIIDKNTELFDFVQNHENECPFSMLHEMAGQSRKGTSLPENSRADISKLIAKDLVLRDKGIAHFRFSVEEELFYLGRPMYFSLPYYGLHPEHFLPS